VIYKNFPADFTDNADFKIQKNMKDKFNKALFWNTKLENIDLEKHARFVIERVLTRGLLSDWKVMKAYYGYDKIKSEVVNIRSMDKITLNFCSQYFNIPKTDFRYYNTEPFIQKLWNV
jgi:hypothetical protein